MDQRRRLVAVTLEEARRIYKYIKKIPGGLDTVYEMMRFIEGNCPSYEKERECGYGYSGITCEKCWKEALG